MIVKVQTSLFNSDVTPYMLIYNEDRSVEYEGPATKGVIEQMQGAVKAFFNATLVENRIKLLERVPPQPW